MFYTIAKNIIKKTTYLFMAISQVVVWINHTHIKNLLNNKHTALKFGWVPVTEMKIWGRKVAKIRKEGYSNEGR